ncbi:hypothetical protein [Halorubellus sp. PRR65]|uniref:hypothetical protein n=1 Tax=Halorubellus sp. PRR65 TaxID=3098148 RepID=UPI002B262F1F|nr:hypothetical protein [Halorubellus sp. PRR65]
MSPTSSVAPVPRVDRVLGALVTFVAGAVLGFVLGILLAPDPTSLVVPLASALAGAVLTGVLVVAGGYDRLLIPVEGRRWTVELAAALVLVVAALWIAETADVASDLLVLALVACSLLGTRWLGDAVADARDWYDRDAYYREGDS